MTQASILFVGQTVPGSRTLQRIKAFENLGYTVCVVSTNLPLARYEDKPNFSTRLRYRLRWPADIAKAGDTMLKLVTEQRFDFLWLERAVEISSEVLCRVKNLYPDIKVIWYAEDDMMNSRHRSRQVEAAMPFFDLWVTTKSFNAEPHEVGSLGVKNVLFVNNSYDSSLHRPVEISDQDQIDFGSEISFVGTYERERADSLMYLAGQGQSVRVWGNGWRSLKNKMPKLIIEDQPVYDDDYVRVICSSKINLCFLRKENRDLQTCRSIEIPACGGFMLHERNDEMSEILLENVEAAFFSDNQELFDQCKIWLADDPRRQSVAKSGLERIRAGSFSHLQRLQEIIEATQRIPAK